MDYTETLDVTSEFDNDVGCKAFADFSSLQETLSEFSRVSNVDFRTVIVNVARHVLDFR